MFDVTTVGRSGLIVMDDGGSTIGEGTEATDRKSWIGLVIPPGRVVEAIQQMRGLQKGLFDLFGVRELHAHELFQRKGPWATVDIDKLKRVVAAVSQILSDEQFPIIVQTFWDGNDSLKRFSQNADMREALMTISGLEVSKPEHMAFAFCLFRLRNYLDGQYPGASWRVVADAGIKKPGQSVTLPLQWGNGQLISVGFEDSVEFELIQLADFVAFFTNRQQQIHGRQARARHDEELLDILGGGWNYINIPLKKVPRQHPIGSDR